MGWRQLGVLVLGLCCAAPVVWGQGYVNIAPGKTYNHSSAHSSSYHSRYAADGNTNSSPYFQSLQENNPYWEVDLGRTYPVYNITVWRYSSTNPHLYPFNIRVDGQHCVTVNSTPTTDRNNSVTCSSLLYGQRVRLTRTDTRLSYLLLSELEILACAPGFFGDKCDQTCWSARCLDNMCHPQTGLCMECGGNFNGSTCSAGYYRSGDSCYPCSSLCASSYCHPSNGSCIECKAGYYRSGDSCYPCSSLCASSHCHPSNGSCIACVTGRWGERCQHSCSETCVNTTCHRDTGVCTECKDGFSKHNSSTCSPCSASCKDRNCHGDTGDCTQGCRPGYHGEKCEESCSDITNQCVQCTQSGECTACSGHFEPPDCTACREGFYLKTEGADHCTECTWKCHNTTFCNNMTGACDRCQSGWEGTRCLQRIKDESSQQSSVPVVGAILGAGLMLTVAVLSVLVFLCWKHRSQKTVQDAETVAASSSDPVTAPNNVYTAPPTASSSTSAQACDVTQHEIRDPGNTYEKLRIYSNMVFDREAHSDPEPRGTDVTTALSTSDHVHVSVEHIYANTSTATEERKPRKKKAN